MAKQFNPITEINKFKNIPTTDLQKHLVKYSPDDMMAMIGVLMVSNFYVRDSMRDILKII